MNVTVTGIFKRIRASSARTVVLEGGTRSGKTWSVIQRLVEICLTATSPLKIVVGRAELTALKRTLFVDFKKVLDEQFGMWDEGSWNKTEMTYELNGSEFQFIGVCDDDGQKIKGLPSDYVWLNECNEIPYGHMKQLRFRMRKQMFLDFNPSCGGSHWLYENVAKEKDMEWTSSTFLDNPFLSKEMVNDILSMRPTRENYANGTADPVLWNIYGLGRRDVVKGLVFPDHGMVDKFPDDARNVCYGLDFGYASDPTALVKKGEVGPDLFLEEVFVMRGLTTLSNPGLRERLSVEGELRRARVRMDVPIYADSQDPKAIDDLRSVGFWVEGVRKGPNSVVDGIDVMRRYRIKLVDGGATLRREFGLYKWAQDRDGKPLNLPVKGNDHCVDASRYAVVMSSGRAAYRSGKFDSARVGHGVGGWLGPEADDYEGDTGVGVFDLRWV